jgi:hypothetical protein
MARQPGTPVTTPAFAQFSFDKDGGVPSPPIAAQRLAAYFDAGGPTLDAVAFHGYLNFSNNGFLYVWPPEAEAVMVTAIQSVASGAGAGAEPIWDTEQQPYEDLQSDGGVEYPFSPNPAVGARIASVARTYFIEMGLGIARHCWFSWDLGDGVFDLYDGGGGLTPVGVAHDQIYQWTVGQTFAAPCGPVAPAATQWSCPLAGANGYEAELLWDPAGDCDGGLCSTAPVSVPPSFLHYRDLAGNTVPLTGGAAPVGAEPILIENQ